MDRSKPYHGWPLFAGESGYGPSKRSDLIKPRDATSGAKLPFAYDAWCRRPEAAQAPLGYSLPT